MTQNTRPNTLRLLGLAFGFAVLLAVAFQTHIFDSNTLMLNSDQLNGLGSRYLRVHDFILTQWDDSRLGGIPTLDALFGDAYHPLVLTQFIMDPARAVGFKFIFCVWMAFISAYLLFKKISGRWEWAAMLAFLYALNPQFFTHIYGGHDGKMMVFSVAPLALLGIVQIIRDGRWTGVLLTAISITWMLLSSHLQLTYFFLWGAGFFTLFEAFRTPISNKLKASRIGLTALGLTFALMIGSFQIIPPYMYTTQQSVRGTAEKTSMGHAVSWSLHAEEMVSMLLPGFLQTDVENERKYWGHNSFKLNHDSAGMALTFLAFISIFVRSNRRNALFWFIGSTLALSYALGANSPLFSLWYHILPGVKNFRAPSMAIFWIPLAMGMMVAPILSSLQDPETRKGLWSGVIAFIGIALISTLARFGWESFVGVPGALISVAFGLVIAGLLNCQDRVVTASIQEAIQSVTSGFKNTPKPELIAVLIPFIFVASVFISGTQIATNVDIGSYFQSLNQVLMTRSATAVVPSIIILIITSLAIWFFIGAKRPLWQSILMIIAISSIDLFVVNHIYVQSVARKDYWQPEHPVVKSIQADSPNSLLRPRVLSLTRQPALSGNMFAAYDMRNALGFHDNELASYREFRGGQGNDNLFKTNDFQNNPFINLLNIGYIIYDTQQGIRPLRNGAALGIATLYQYWDTASSEAAISKLKADHDYRHVALLENLPSELKVQLPLDSSVATNQGRVELVSSPKMDTQVFHVESPGAGIVVVSGNYHPYWKASINSNPVEVVRAFGTLRAVAVPAGTSELVMTYRSDAVAMSTRISIAGIILIILFTLAALFMSRRRNA